MSIDRAAFVGGSAAVLTALEGTAIDAQTAQFGHPHPPVVAEDDPAITVAHPQLNAPAGTIAGYAATPKTVTATTPGIVMVHHIWGIDAVMRDFARRFAKAGYVTIVPALFGRFDPPDGDGSDDVALFLPFFAKMYAADHQHGDLLSGHAWVRAQAPRGKIGIYGNCGGGGIALQELVGNDDYAAAAIWYGYVRSDRKSAPPTPPEALVWAKRVSAAVVAGYGGADKSIDLDDVATAYGMLRGPHDYKVYPDAPHAYLDDTRSSYRAAAATDSWARMMSWYGRYLSG